MYITQRYVPISLFLSFMAVYIEACQVKPRKCLLWVQATRLTIKARDRERQRDKEMEIEKIDRKKGREIMLKQQRER